MPVNENQILEKLLNEVKELKELVRYQSDKFFTVPYAAKYLGISEGALYKLTHRNEIPFYKPNGKIIYFQKSELDNWICRKRPSSKHELKIVAQGK